MKIKIYCNYGCLSAEKRNIYTYGCPDSTATCWDEMTVEIPEGWEVYEKHEDEGTPCDAGDDDCGGV